MNQNNILYLTKLQPYYNYIKYLIFFLLIAILSGCTTNKPIIVDVQKKQYIVPTILPVKMNNVYFYVVNVNDKEFNEFKTRFVKENNSTAFVAFSVKDYENLSLNVSELKRYIEQQKKIIDYYKKINETE